MPTTFEAVLGELDQVIRGWGESDDAELMARYERIRALVALHREPLEGEDERYTSRRQLYLRLALSLSHQVTAPVVFQQIADVFRSLADCYQRMDELLGEATVRMPMLCAYRPVPRVKSLI